MLTNSAVVFSLGKNTPAAGGRDCHSIERSVFEVSGFFFSHCFLMCPRNAADDACSPSHDARDASSHARNATWVRIQRYPLC